MTMTVSSRDKPRFLLRQGCPAHPPPGSLILCAGGYHLGMSLRWLVVVIALLPVAVFGLELKSPDGNVVLTFEVKDQRPVYGVTYKGRTVIAESRLGLELTGCALDRDLMLVGQKFSEADSTWTPVCGERSTIRDHFKQLVVDLKQVNIGSRT